MAKKKEETPTKLAKILPSEINADGSAWEYAQPDSTLEINGRVHTIGSPCDGWTPEQLDEYRFSLRGRA